ncbi:anti-sigma factor family protein [Streptomyces sp. STR69]|uniref:anti-sigma factor family protein n=1 Tax=Streptomyces sp. STR69 TaxID=1796942 RepID=UPI0021C58735|nr:zf-HC2 domain-containing protein [Streptomyces sp. STR69]
MRCEQETTELAAYAMAALDPGETARVGRHVRACPGCAGEVDEIRTALAAVRLLPDEELLGDWSGRLFELREAAVRAALAKGPPVPRQQ